MNEPTTREEYKKAFAALDDHPIVGDHKIGLVKVSVSYKRWTLTDQYGNTKSGPVKSGADVRHRVRVALKKWLRESDIR